MALTVTPLDAPLGARIAGIDLSKDLSSEAFETIHRAWLDHLVLIFPDQEMTEQDQLRFPLLWGEMPQRSRYSGRREENRRAHQSVMLVSNIREDGEPIGSLPDGDMMFHSDGSYDEHPYRYTMLHAIEVPRAGGDTLFANMYAAYDALDDSLKSRLSTLRARHGYYAGRHVTAEIKQQLGISDDVPDSCTHPLVTAHEETGRPVLFVSRLLTQSIDGAEDSLLDDLLDHAERPEFVYQHRWAPGDFVIWDNRCVNHARTDFSAGERRLLRRTTVQGVRPDAAFSDAA